MLLPSPAGHHYYTTFYILAFLLNQALLLWEGHRRGYPLRSWLLLTSGATLAFIVGTKLIAIPAAEWPALWQHGQWPVSTARSVLGGAIGGTLAVLVLRRWLGFGWHVLDAFAIPMCAAYVVQCVGCLLTGCCFGHLAPAGWGVQYAPDTVPFLAQVQRGLIEPTAAYSLPVLPTQLFSALLCVATGAVIWLTRRRPWPGGSWRLLQVALLLTGRFVIEFWRDPAGEQVGAAVREVAGLPLKQVQWSLLPLLLLAFGWWWQRTHLTQTPTPERIPAVRPLRNLGAVVALLGATALLGPGALTLPEILVVKAALAVALALEIAALLQQGAARPRRVGLPLGLASLVLLFTNQAPAPSDTAATRRYLTIGLGGAQGAYDQDIVDKGGCGSSATRMGYYHRYAVVGGSIEYNQDKPERTFTGVGLGVWSGYQRIGFQALDVDGPFLTTGEDGHVERRLWDINPYVEFRSRSKNDDLLGLGIRGGLHFGHLAYPARALRREQNVYRGGLQAVPEFMIWFGARRKAFGQFDFGLGPLALGNYTTRLGLGSGFGSRNGTYVLAGVAAAQHAPNGAMGFVSAQLHLGRTGILLEPNLATNFGRHYRVQAQVRYQLPLNAAAKR